MRTAQLEYGSDTSGDGIPDAYLPDTSVTPPFPNNATGWWNVMTVKISLLARNETISPDYTDTKTYVLAGTNYTPGGKYRRHAYTSTVRLANPAGRREP